MGRYLWKIVFWVASPGLRPSRSLTTRAPAPGRGTLGRASIVLFDGEGVPSPAPPRVIPPRSGVWGDAGEGHNRGCFLRPAFPGISPALPPLGGGERTAGAGRGGSQENSVWNAGEWCPGSSSPAAPFMGSRHENPAPARGHWEGAW